MASTQQASNLYNDQQKATAQTIADILAQGDALKGDAQGRISGGSQGYYTGGTSGGYVDNRPQVNQQYDVIRGDVANLFGQAVGAIQAQAPQIQQDAQGRLNLIGSALYSQGEAARQQQINQQGDQVLAAQRLGIAADPQMQRSNSTAAALTNYRNGGADAQKGYFTALRGTALGRNQAQADAFAHAGDEQAQAIERARQQALADAYYWVGGSRGRYVSTYGSADKKADRSLISAITKEQKSIASDQKKEAAQRAKDPSIRQSAVQANRRLT